MAAHATDSFRLRKDVRPKSADFATTLRTKRRRVLHRDDGFSDDLSVYVTLCWRRISSGFVQAAVPSLVMVANGVNVSDD